MRVLLLALGVLLLMPKPSAAADKTPALPGSAVSGPADWILRGATVHPGGGEPGRVADIAVRGERIAFFGQEAEAEAFRGPETRVLDGDGLHVYPGLVDAHAHLQSLGQALERVDLVGAESVEECLRRIEERAKTMPADAWVLGRGWDQNDWPVQQYPTTAELDAVTGGRPVYLERIDGHAAWVSSAALARAGVDAKTRDPDGGLILRDESGTATGILIDRACDLVEAVIPQPDASSLRRAYLAAQEACLAAGLTGMHDMGVNARELAVLRAMDASGELKLRVYAALTDDPALWEQEFATGVQLADSGRRLTVRSVKLFTDGALGSRGAALFEEYADRPGQYGLLTTPAETLKVRALRAGCAGFQVCIHAIGDRGNAAALTACEGVVAETRAGAPDASPAADPRPRIEHAQILRPVDIPRFAASGIIASMQPTHCTSDMPWAPDRLGQERLRGAYAWRDLLQSGARLALGSDFPVESHDPRLGLYAAVTRQAVDGMPAGGWSPDQRLTLAEALDGFSAGAAYASFQEKDLGRIEAGRLADLTVFGEELSESSPRALLTAVIAATISGGQTMFADEPELWRGHR